MKYTILIIFLVTSFILPGQERHSFIAIQSGVSIPVGKYSSNNLDEGCFTTTGVNFSLEGAWFFKKYLGIGAQLGVNFHPVDVGMLGYEKVQANPFVSDMTIRSDSYQILTGAIGFYGRWDVWKKLSLQAKLLGGVMRAQTPYQLYKPEYFLVEPKWFEITPSSDYNLSLITGIAVQYDVSNCIGLKINADYTYSKMAFGFNTSNGIRYDYRDISFINIDFGVVIIL